MTSISENKVKRKNVSTKLIVLKTASCRGKVFHTAVKTSLYKMVSYFFHKFMHSKVTWKVSISQACLRRANSFSPSGLTLSQCDVLTSHWNSSTLTRNAQRCLDSACAHLLTQRIGIRQNYTRPPKYRDRFTHRPNRPWPRAPRFWRASRSSFLWRLNIN